MSAREKIFAKIRALRPERAGPAEIQSQARAIAERMKQALPPADVSDLPALFTARVTADKVGATLERLDGFDALPQAVAHYVEANGLPNRICVQPDARLKSLPWAPLDPDGQLAPDSLLAVGAALAGVAETGSLVFHSGPSAPTLYEFMPLHHLVALESKNLLPRLEDYPAFARGLAVPRNVNFVTGASGTTDIEGVLARGAHGPGRLHIFLID